tara:strand:- start:3866 stop:4066 length:201 start_codon:yes stop_codon:yes gene_type:complete
MKLSLEQEKYLCMLNGLNAFRLIKLEHQKQVQVGLSNIKNNSPKLEEYESQLEMINTVLKIRSLSN